MAPKIYRDLSALGCQGRKTGVGVTTVSNSLILGRWVTKGLKNGEKNRGVEGWVTTIF